MADQAVSTMTSREAVVHHVTAQQANQTVAALLRTLMPGQSWSQVRNLIAVRRVMINGNLCLDPARRLKEGDVLKILPHPGPKPPTQEDIKIRYLDGQIIVIEKPAGITTVRHPAEADWPARRKQLQPTLDELLPRIIARYENKRLPKGKMPRIRPVHRLDRETSGLMVFARTAEAERHLGLQFRKHTIHRRYLAIVLGAPKEQTIDTYLVRDRGDKRRGSTKLKGVGKRAITHVKPLERLGDYTLIECRLETGRTHQIRIHLAEKGHPLCGEKVYNQPLFQPPIPDHSGAPRLALHAAELGFEHPTTGEHLHFEMPLPSDLQEFLDRLRRQARRQKP
ncbi:MAG: RluA family pseudouridine synthase [Gemmatales bacterium]|nr:RluA family pseudouridine synthase [Gemmatales bacterium]MDW8387644.1 RluA family pseudouridine synthase [Gemmatales bacterium]